MNFNQFVEREFGKLNSLKLIKCFIVLLTASFKVSYVSLPI